MQYKIKSSALLIAMSMGILLSGLIIGVAVTMGQYTKLTGQSREGRAAYRAALSGVEDGLLRYKYAVAQGKTDEFFKIKDQEINLQPSDASKYATYKLSVSAGSLTVGNQAIFDNWGSDWSDPNIGVMRVDDVIDIDLSYWAKFAAPGEDGNRAIGSIKIYFSKPFTGSRTAPSFLASPNFTALNYQLINVQNLSASGESGQRMSEGINTIVSAKSISVEKILDCMDSATDKCHLRIKPMAVKKNLFGTGSTMATRLDGATGSASGRRILYAIEARDKSGNLIVQEHDQPGIIVITSVGKVGQAVRKIDAKIDASSGQYLGLFDYGVFCGAECKNI